MPIEKYQYFVGHTNVPIEMIIPRWSHKLKCANQFHCNGHANVSIESSQYLDLVAIITVLATWHYGFPSIFGGTIVNTIVGI